SSTMRPPPPSSAVPSTTLFRSRAARASVLATDIDTQVLSRARAGIYAAERVARMEPARLKRFFLRGRGANEGQVRVRGVLARMVRFEPLNLLAPAWPIGERFDAIFCRNVMIYFDKPTQV